MFELNKSVYLSYLEYLIKCIIGVAICYEFYITIPEYPFNWALVSVVLAISLDNSTSVAYDRIKANVLGCTIGALLYLVELPELLVICLGVIIVVLLAIAFKITSTLRSALAALIIIMLHIESGRHWYIALERAVCVAIGCVVALLLTLIFNWLRPKWPEFKVENKLED